MFNHSLRLFFAQQLCVAAVVLVGRSLPGSETQQAAAAQAAESVRSAQELFLRADFEAERQARIEAIESLGAYLPADHPDITLQRAYLRSVDAVLRLPEAGREEIRGARRRIALATTMHTDAPTADPRCLAEYEAALATYVRLVGDTDGVVAELVYRVGAAFEATGRPDEAIPVLRRAAKLKAEQHGVANAAGPQNSLCLALIASGDLVVAEVEGKRAVALAEAGWGAESPHHAIAMFNLALVRRKAGRYEAAAATYKRAETCFAQCGQRSVVREVQCLLGQAECLVSMGRAAESLEVYETVLDTLQSPPTPHVPGVAKFLPNVYREYAGALHAAGDLSGSEDALRRSEELRRRLEEASPTGSGVDSGEF